MGHNSTAHTGVMCEWTDTRCCSVWKRMGDTVIC